MSLMKMGLPGRLRGVKFAADASNVIRTIPTLGGFLSLNMLCYLQSSPHLSFDYRDFASCGPGSRIFLQAMFGPGINSVAMEEAGLQWLQENQWTYYASIGVDPPHAWELGIRPGMRVLDFENALCWCHRYVHEYLNKDYSSFADLPMPETRNDEFHAPAWCEEEKDVLNPSRPVFVDDYDQAKLKAENPEIEDQQGTWEVEKVVGRLGNRTDKDGLLRVRWKGYPPEEDTYERVSSLMEDAEEATKEWLDWEDTVWDTIAQVKKDYPYQGEWKSSQVKQEVVTRATETRSSRHVTPKKGLRSAPHTAPRDWPSKRVKIDADS